VVVVLLEGLLQGRRVELVWGLLDYVQLSRGVFLLAAMMFVASSAFSGLLLLYECLVLGLCDDGR
jgi:hypothetical protein